MSIWDWLIVIIPLIIVAFIGLKTQKYVKGVSDFLTAGRVAGRYVLCVAAGEATFGLISLVAMYEAYYQSGWAYGFWGGLATPIFIILGLTGFCSYRYRETRAMTMGQFLEIRYNRSFRIFAAILQSISGIINYGLFPAVGARFIVYFCGLPLTVEFMGWVMPTFVLVMAFFLGLAVFVATMGGQITIMVTDCVQGMLGYPLFTAIVIFIIFRFSWFGDIGPALLDRPTGQSLLNPYDTTGLRDFNILYVLIGIIGNIVNRMSWSGAQGYNAAAVNAHEQKMAGVLGNWRGGYSGMMFILLAVVAFTFLNSAKFSQGSSGAAACRNELALKAFNDVANGSKFDTVREEYANYLATGEIAPSLQERIDKVQAEEAAQEEAKRVARPQEQQEIPEVAEKPADPEPMLTVGKAALKSVSPKEAQVFGTIFGQMRVPMALRYILPVGLLGAFCAICIFLMITTDTTYMHSWGSIIVQDLILPLRGKPFTPRQQLMLLRTFIPCVAVFAFFFSIFFGQVDYILMFFAITGAIWLGGSGVCIVGGLYWKRATTAGAFSALIAGSSLAIFGVIGQNFWVDKIYPFIVEHNLLGIVTRIVEGISSPLEPMIKWRVTPDKFPINSQEIYGITLLVSIGLYVIVSLLTCRKPFNMDRMLHRGKYQREGKKIEHRIKGVKDFLLKLIGINEEYSLGDKVLSWSVFIWSMGYGFIWSVVIVFIWNMIYRWPDEWWSVMFFVNNVVLGCIIGTVSTVWFTVGGVLDLRRLFKRLKAREVDILDDGRVIDNVSADDIHLVEELDDVVIEEAHIEEKILEEELKNEKDAEDMENRH